MQSDTRVLAEGIRFGECPRWHNGRLWFSDFFAHEVKSVSMAGDLHTEFTIDDQPSGLGWLPDGSLLIVSMNKRQVLRRSPEGALNVHANIPNAGFRCNDMVVDAAGRAFVGDFGFDLDTELLQRGVESVLADHPTAQITCVAPNGSVRIAAEGMHFPNGSVITPDGTILIVAETLAGVLTAFDIGSEGRLHNRRIWASTWPRIADGLALNLDGNIWTANPLAAECVLIAEGGAIVEVVETDQPCYACMLGGNDGRTLFMLTAPSSLPSSPDSPPAGKILVRSVPVRHAGLP